MAIDCHDCSFREQPHRHQEGASHHQSSSGPFVNKKECWDGHDNVLVAAFGQPFREFIMRNRTYDDILDGSCDKPLVPTQSGDLKYINDIVHHRVGASELRPDVGEAGRRGSHNVSRLENLKPASVS